MSHLEAHAGFFRLLMKGIFYASKMWALKADVSEEILKWHSHSLSLSAEL